eukprot:jgi/Chlat1/5800/Chrsp4S06275
MATITAVPLALPSLAPAARQPSRMVASTAAPAVKPMRNYAGLRKDIPVSALAQATSCDERFAELSRKVRAGMSARGGALVTKNGVGEETLAIVPVMIGITLIGLAFGFILLRVEALTEEE